MALGHERLRHPGLHGHRSWRGRSRARHPLRHCGTAPALALALVCILSPLAANWHHNDRSEDHWAADFAENVLVSMEPDAIYVPDADYASFPARYLQAVEGIRPDVAIARKYGYVDRTLAADMPAERKAALGEFPRGRDEAEYFAWLLEHTQRPVYFQRPPKLPRETGVTFRQAGLLQRALRPGETLPTVDYWGKYIWRTLDPRDTHGDYTAELILLDVDFARARQCFARGDAAGAHKHIEAGLAIFGREAIVLNNAGGLCAKYGAYAAARDYFEEALRRAPAQEAARNNLDRLENKQGG